MILKGKILSILKKWPSIMSFKALVIFLLILIPTKSQALTTLYSFIGGSGGGGNSSQWIHLISGNGYAGGITFVAGTNYTAIDRIDFAMFKTGSPGSMDWTLRIYTISGGLPSSLVAESQVLDTSVIKTDTDYLTDCPELTTYTTTPLDTGPHCMNGNFLFSSPFNLTSGTSYMFLVSAYGSGADNSNYISFWDATSNPTGYMTQLRCNDGLSTCTSDSGYNPFFAIYSGASVPPDTSTRIIDFTPADNSTTTSPVTFSLHGYINPDDLTTIKGVKLTLHNIDQNVILLGSLSPSDIYLFEGNATTSGDFYFSTSTPLGDGNYRLEACIERTYFWGWIINIFSPINDCQSHQFVVGEETFIGHISQSIWTETQSLFASSTATSTTALAGSCNPLSGDFSVTNCCAFLFVPDGKGLSDTMKSAREGILSRVPWGYLTRLYYLMNNSATSTLPTFTTTIQVGPGDDMTPEQTTLSFDVGDMVAGAGALVDSIEDPIHGQTFRDVFYPIVQLVVALGVIITIVSDITGSHRHADGGEVRQTKLS